MEIKDAWKLSMLIEAGYIVRVHSSFADSEVMCIRVLDKTGDIAVSESDAVSATFDSDVFSGEDLMAFEVHDVSVTKPCIRWEGNMNHLSCELERMANQDGYMEAFLDDYEKKPSLLSNF